MRSATLSSRSLFLSTPSARRATTFAFALMLILSNFYPRPLRGGRPESLENSLVSARISIHALCEEGDVISGLSRLFF